MPFVFTELYVTKGSGAAASNAGFPLGANDGPILTLPSVTAAVVSGADHSLVDNGGGSWPGVSVGHLLVFDTAGARVWAVVKQLSYAGATTILVTNMAGSASFAAAAKAVNVGGAWALPSQAAAITNKGSGATWPGTLTGKPPRLNIKTDNTGASSNVDYTETGSISFSFSGVAAVPFLVLGYCVNPGDLDPYTTFNRAVIDFGNNAWTFSLAANLVHAANLEVRTSKIANWSLVSLNTSTVNWNLAVNLKAVMLGAASNQFVFSSSGSGIKCVAVRCWAVITDGINNTGFRTMTCIGCLTEGTTKLYKTYGFYNTNANFGCVAVNCNVGFGYCPVSVDCTAVNCVNGVDTENQFASTNINVKVGNCTTAFKATGNTPYMLGSAYLDMFGNSANYDASFLPLWSHDATAGPVFNNYAGGDYSPAAGGPGNDMTLFFQSGAGWTSYNDCGALDRQHAGGATIIIDD